MVVNNIVPSYRKMFFVVRMINFIMQAYIKKFIWVGCKGDSLTCIKLRWQLIKKVARNSNLSVLKNKTQRVIREKKLSKHYPADYVAL